MEVEEKLQANQRCRVILWFYQAIAQVFTRVYEPTFSDNSFGFRSRRGANNAITKIKRIY